MRREELTPYSPENLARLFKDELKVYDDIRTQANDQWKDYVRRVAGTADSYTDKAYRKEYKEMTSRAQDILDDIVAQAHSKEDIDMAAVVKAYKKLKKLGALDEPVLPLPDKRVINIQNYSQFVDDIDWNTKVGENFILYPDNERYEVTYAEEGDYNVICTNLDEQETITFNKAELTQMFHNNEIRFI